jgi:hypothetical protein
MNDQVHHSKAEVDNGMPEFILFILRLDQGNSAFYDPEDQEAANQKSHSLQRSLLQILEIINDLLPHNLKIVNKPFFGIGAVTKENQSAPFSGVCRQLFKIVSAGFALV